MTARRLLQDASGRVWIGTEAGLFCSDPAAGTLHPYRLGASSTASLSDYVWALHEDRTHGIWVGTRSGLFRLDPNLKRFAHARLVEDEASGVHNPVMALHQGRAGTVWLGTLDGLFHTASPAHLYAHREHSVVEHHHVSGELIWSIAEDPAGTLWLGTGRGLIAYTPETGEAALHPLPVTPDSAPAIFALAKAADPDHLWLAGDTDLFLFDTQDAVCCVRCTSQATRGSPRSKPYTPEEMVRSGSALRALGCGCLLPPHRTRRLSTR